MERIGTTDDLLGAQVGNETALGLSICLHDISIYGEWADNTVEHSQDKDVIKEVRNYIEKIEKKLCESKELLTALEKSIRQ